MIFAENLKKQRKNLGYSAKEMAELLKVKYTTYASWENGKEPKYETLVYIADTLDISVDMLIKSHDKKKDDLLDQIFVLFNRVGINYKVKRNKADIQYVDLHIVKEGNQENYCCYRFSKDEFVEIGVLFLNQTHSFKTVYIKSLALTLFALLELLAKDKLVTDKKEAD